MVNLEQATSRAKEFLGTVAGMPTLFSVLEAAVLEEDVWVVSYCFTPLVGSPVIYKVKMGREDGEVLEYSKSKAK